MGTADAIVGQVVIFEAKCGFVFLAAIENVFNCAFRRHSVRYEV